ncbi:hypothetical protein HanHA300_Chr16g0613651 [Helianthus annuus]|nr:hypothetical protein HanHA300_Chr16g0613651 [Helianthus annuus]KAJ0460734.1 hypothetical protein HanHA89_Chr16g0664251 [Helianthus annuus]KAJ0798462.1 hypothetical protein HanLR1_Chr00c3030g0864921 [Helianthus annuus]
MSMNSRTLCDPEDPSNSCDKWTLDIYRDAKFKERKGSTNQVRKIPMSFQRTTGGLSDEMAVD